MRTLLLILALLPITHGASAAERYISGIPIPLRAEPDSSNRQIIQLLSVGDSVSLNNSSKNGFSSVTTTAGKRGWIPSRYLSKTPPLTSTAGSQPVNGRAAADNQKQVQIKLENSRLKSRVASIKQEKQILESEIQKLKEVARKATQEVEAIRGVSGNALELENQNHVLRDQVRVQKRELDALQQENGALQDRKDRDWFLVGVLVTFLALLTGFLLSRVRSSNVRRGPL